MGQGEQSEATGLRSVTSISSKIAVWVATLDGRALPETALAKLRLAVLDTLAAMLSGVHEPVTGYVMSTLVTTTVEGPATVVGHRNRASVVEAALANGTMAHACDYDDTSWTVWGHPSAPALPAILATAERRGCSGLDVLTALAAAIEVQKAFGLAFQPHHYAVGWAPAATLGVFGAAAGAAKVLGLYPQQVQMALGIAASRSAALQINAGTTTKPLQVGFAARDGLETALLAAAGASSNPYALDGTRGFFDVYGPGHGPVTHIAENLGHPFEVIDPGLSPKLYPSCSETHAAIDAILEIRGEHALAPEAVRRIRCGLTAVAVNNLPYTKPETPPQCRFSADYCVATALVKGRLGIAEFESEAIDDGRVRDLMSRIEVYVHPDLVSDEPLTYSSPAVVTVETVEGQTYEKRIDAMRGHPENPIDSAEIKAKFLDCGSRVLDDGRLRRAIAMIAELDVLPDIGRLMRELVPADQGQDRGRHHRRRALGGRGAEPPATDI